MGIIITKSVEEICREHPECCRLAKELRELDKNDMTVWDHVLSQKLFIHGDYSVANEHLASGPSETNPYLFPSGWPTGKRERDAKNRKTATIAIGAMVAGFAALLAFDK